MLDLDYLWSEFHFQFSGEKLSLKLWVLSHVGGNHALYLAPLEEDAQAKVFYTVCVR